MNRLFVLALGGTSALGLNAASAADIFVPPPPIEYIEKIKPDYSGWYIRGDVGYAVSSRSSGEYNLFYGPSVPDSFSRYHYDSIKLKDGYSLGAGVGYRVTEHFRADVTADYYDFKVEGASDCPIFFGAAPCYYDDRSSADIWTVMANAYVDFPYFGPVTPYFGAGLGFAHVSYGDLKNDVISRSTGLSVFNDVHKGEDSWRFAASLSAGVSYDVTDALALDLGYRYTRIQKGDAWGYDTTDIAAGASGVQTKDNGFDIHAVRAGLRYSFF